MELTGISCYFLGAGELHTDQRSGLSLGRSDHIHISDNPDTEYQGGALLPFVSIPFLSVVL